MPPLLVVLFRMGRTVLKKTEFLQKKSMPKGKGKEVEFTLSVFTSKPNNDNRKQSLFIELVLCL